MGNTHSMNNLSVLEQKSGFKYSTEFLRYSQIPYEAGHHQHLANPNLPHHQFKYKDRDSAQLPNQIKVLPDVKFESRLRPTNNGMLLQNGGTISARKENESGLQRSKSISENDGFIVQNGMPFVMQRARTQLQINHQPQMKTNLSRNFGSNMDIRLQEIKSLDRPKLREAPKKQKAPPPPVVSKSKPAPKPAPAPQRVPEKPKQASQKPQIVDAKPKIVGTRLFGDTLKKSQTQTNEIFNSKNKMIPTVAPTKTSIIRQRSNEKSQDVKKLPPLTRHNPTSFFRRERTFDMTLMQPERTENSKKFSPQLPKKKNFDIPHVPVKKQSSNNSMENKVPANLRASSSSLFQDELKAAARRRSIQSNSNTDKMRTIDRPLKKTTMNVELRKSTSAINGSTLSLAVSQKSNSFKERNPSPAPVIPESKSPVAENIIEEKEEPIVKQDNPKNFYFGMNDKPASSPVVPQHNEYNTNDEEQMEAINKFAEDIFKMTGGGRFLTQNQVSSESALSSDVEDAIDSSDICLNLRPTLPKKQPQIPRFSPVQAWKSLSIETNFNETKIDQILSTSTMHLHLTEETKTEVKIERIIREPSFNMMNSQQDTKSGDSGISAGDVGNTPENNIPAAYLMTSWTPQQDLEDEEESVAALEEHQESEKLIESDSNNTLFSNNGHIFSLSLPRESHCSSEKTPQNNFYSLQKFKNKVADVFNGVSISTLNDKIQISNYGVDGNWMLSSQPNSIDDFKKMENEKNQIISHLTSGKHVMYLPSKFNDRDVIFESKVVADTMADDIRESLQDPEPINKYREEEIFTGKSKSKNKKFTFQSTIRQVERRKIAEKLSREAEEKEQLRLSEQEAMQKVEEEFQKKRAREKASIRHQLQIYSLEEDFEVPQNNSNYSPNLKASNNFGSNYMDFSDDDESINFIDTKTPYISRIIEMKSSKRVSKISDNK